MVIILCVCAKGKVISLYVCHCSLFIAVIINKIARSEELGIHRTQILIL